MSDASIAKRYATALFEVVGDVSAAGGVRGELNDLAEILEQPGLRTLLENPRVTPEEKLGVLDAVASRAGASAFVANLLRVLVQNGRGGLLRQVAQEFGRLVDQAEGRVTVTITSAVPLSKNAEKTLSARIASLIGAKADIRHQVDADILGGLVVQIGSKIFDHSIRHQLAQLRHAL